MLRRPSQQQLVAVLRATLPLLLAAFLGGLVALALQPDPPAQQPVIQVVTPTVLKAAATEVLPAPAPTPMPATPTIIIFPEDTISLELVTLRRDLEFTAGSLHLLRATIRIQNARIAHSNLQTGNVEAQLDLAQADLDAAFPLVSDEVRAAIQGLNDQINYLRDDLSIRPETIDSRLADLTEQVLVLANRDLP
ncbi:hypothetical protein [Herpetosiphon geysericola]|uniref:Uncharacterized protein n=1 Tax=Herpetosiphon geysericola TaxID=70996 RepID=A0A0P6YQ94_9CHLR|nr:hypothetical protein [Herpetosiphon geysericola]KPL85214.1 hypothetical protein SE18_16105 [Herpetosiphon geysericola]